MFECYFIILYQYISLESSRPSQTSVKINHYKGHSAQQIIPPGGTRVGFDALRMCFCSLRKQRVQPMSALSEVSFGKPFKASGISVEAHDRVAGTAQFPLPDLHDPAPWLPGSLVAGTVGPDSWAGGRKRDG